jgi:hypothetical protein
MALQTVTAIQIADPLNPVELQTWCTNNPLAVITTLVIHRNVFYILHT